MLCRTISGSVLSSTLICCIAFSCTLLSCAICPFSRTGFSFLLRLSCLHIFSSHDYITVCINQISIFIKQIAFAAMETGISEEIINQVVPAAIGKSWELASKLLLDPMEGMKLAVELFDHGNNSLKLYGLLLRNYRVAKKALLLSDMKENEILKLLGLTEKQMRGIRAYRKLPEERLDTVMSILIEAMNRTKISFGNERNLFIQTMAKLIIL